jgi:hypothetical protein
MQWEYAQLRLTRDPGKDGVPVYGWLALPEDETWQSLGELEESRSLINKLGSEGWEMVGSPTSQAAVFTYKAANDVWHDRGYWVERDFWFKRQVEE